METDKTLTKTSNTSTTLQQIITTPTAQMLRAGKFDELRLSLAGNVKNAIEKGIPVMVMAQAVDRSTVIQYIDFELRMMAGKVNIDARLNLQAHQIPEIAQAIFDNFKTESLEDFVLAFFRGASGFYGEIFRLDCAVIIRWVTLYLDEKYTYVEDVHQKEKSKDSEPVNYQAFQERLTKEREQQNTARQKEIERRKQDADRVIDGKQYVPMTSEEILEREIRALWFKNNYDKDGNKKEDWMGEDAWVEANIEMIKKNLKG